MTSDRLSIWWPRAVGAFALAAIVAVGVVVGALAAGYRPVVIQTGSMGDTAPPGSLIVAAPRDGAQIDVGDILVMRRPGATPVTHRVIEVERGPTTAFAITQGDANEAPDAALYALEGEQLVARWIAPGWGGRLETVFQPGIALAIMALATVAIAFRALRGIWSDPEAAFESTPEPGPTPAPAPRSPIQRRRRWIGAAAVPLLGLMSVGVAWALFQSSEVVASNNFGTAACFDPQLTSVQSGETVHAVSGTVSVAITPVDPAGSFVMASARSSSNEPADSAVEVRLANGGADVELVRATDAGAPPAVTVAWSVVEYGCGVTVQRGTATGTGTNQIDIPVAAVDAAASFVLTTSAPEAAAADFGTDDLFSAQLTSATNLRIRSTGSPVFDPARTFAWQVVTFDDPGDVMVQNVGITLGVGVSSGAIPLPSPADPSTTFLLASVNATSTGPDIGERLVRAHLADANTVSVSRGVSGDPVDIDVQVITLRDGSTVRHGTIDFATSQPARTITIEPVDVSRSTAISTVVVPGAEAGGRTDHTTDDVVGEASATFVLSDAQTVSANRAATASNASFGWQVIEWAGPQWWDPAYTFRQPINIDTGIAAAPGEYSVPLDVDHASLVALGLSQLGGTDARVVRWDGAAWTELDRVLGDAEGWNDAATTLWFRTVDAIAADDTSTYWLYFGNPTAGAPPEDPENVWLLTEDFESGTLGDFEDRTGGTGWYSAAPWTRRIAVTVPAGRVGADLIDFPLLVSVTNADLAASARSDGADIRFTAADGVTPLAHEIESWNAGTGAVEAWVRVPTLSSTTATSVYLYYGAPDAPAQDDVRGTWPQSIEAVWHMASDPAGSAPQVDDSSANNHDGISSGAMTSGDLVAGRVGGAAALDGANDLFEVDAFDLPGAGAVTLSGWVNLDSYVSDGRIVTKADTALARIFELAVQTDGALRARLSLDGSTTELIAGVGTVGLGAWHHLAATWDGTTLRGFVDGTERGSTPAAGILDTDPTMPVTLGNVATADRQLDGRLDEVRVEKTARSSAWLAGAESNQRAPGAFLAVGAPQTGVWFDQGTWAFRKPIGVDSDVTTTDLTDFAVVIEITDTEMQTGAQSDADDIVFTADDGLTRLDHVIESYDSGTGALTAWVSVPFIDATTGAQIFAYYGNPAAFDQQDAAAVFGPNADLAFLGIP
jgi:signal peptidase I